VARRRRRSRDAEILKKSPKKDKLSLLHRNKYHVMRFDFTVPVEGDAADMLHEQDSSRTRFD
jgi:hypothetical protein